MRDLSVLLERLEWPVGHAETGGRLDHFLQNRLPWRSRNEIHGMLRDGLVTQNGQVVRRKAGRVLLGDVIVLRIPPPAEEARHEALGLALAGLILHEDRDLLALNKPPGLVVHPVGRTRVNTLIQAVHWLFRHGPRKDPTVNPMICHRLDRDTSGVLILAKSVAARQRIQDTFETRDVEKVYEALVAGRVEADRGTIDLPIGPDEEHPRQVAMTTRPDGLPSRTRYEVVERFEGASRVRFAIETGRQHQIRVHARAIGHHVLLDPLYGDGRVRWPAPPAEPVIVRQALHAWRVALAHPRTGEPLALEAPLPADMAAYAAALRAGS